jgi:hypothetical protein
MESLLDYQPPPNGGRLETVRLTETALSDAETDALAGAQLDDRAYDHVYEGDTDVYKPDGSMLLRLRHNIVPEKLCAETFPYWKAAATTTANRGHAAGRIESQDELDKLARERGHPKAVRISPTRAVGVKQDGSFSNTTIAKIVESGIVGYFDRNARYPYCRLTAYNFQHNDWFARLLPFIRYIDGAFKKLAPERYAAQLEYVKRTNDDFYIHGTGFTTVTVNRNFQTAVHKDVGDLKEGFGVMSCLRRGRYDGCFFVYPKYRVAVNMSTGCVLCSDVHEWHGNSPMRGNKGMFDRVSLVFYYREKMERCGSVHDELERAKRIRTYAPEAAAT